ncbi:MAG: PstS family phosphate ABC transporter substrate-binding protein [Euryarchaeota archaeon]|jgi:phosphate transport system substrate-binding protein|nr:PstS family phosphate ABC transporter substrate-binding protein [Euryarchaeota archaeon]
MGEKTQKKMKILAAVLIIGMVGIVSLAGCTTQKENTIKVSGAYSLYPMMVVWAQEYQTLHPDIKIDVSSGGAGKGMADALAGSVDLGMVSRDVTTAEADQGIIAVAVVEDAVLATINTENPVLNKILEKGLTKHQLREIFINYSISTWGQLVGDSNNTDPIKVYSRSDPCGAAEAWVKYLGDYTQDDIPTIENITKVKGDDSMSKSIASDPLGIGYSNVNYIYSNATKAPKEGIAVVPLDLNENGTIDPEESFYESRDDVVNAEINNTLPSPPSRLVYLVTLNNFTGITKDFVRWILTDGQQYTFDNGYSAVPNDILNDQLQILEGE